MSVGVGRVHYGMTRWIGTTGSKAAESYQHIPATGEIRDERRVLVVGAGGPMGQMHVIRDICLGLSGLQVVGTDVDDRASRSRCGSKAAPMAKANGVDLQPGQYRQQRRSTASSPTSR